jgi:hypothetical protein
MRNLRAASAVGDVFAEGRRVHNCMNALSPYRDIVPNGANARYYCVIESDRAGRFSECLGAA